MATLTVGSARGRLVRAVLPCHNNGDGLGAYELSDYVVRYPRRKLFLASLYCGWIVAEPYNMGSAMILFSERCRF